MNLSQWLVHGNYCHFPYYGYATRGIILNRADHWPEEPAAVKKWVYNASDIKESSRMRSHSVQKNRKSSRTRTAKSEQSREYPVTIAATLRDKFKQDGKNREIVLIEVWP